MKLVVYAFLTALLATSPSAFANTESPCEVLLSELIELGDAPDLEYKGITKEGIKRIDAAAESLAHTENAFNQVVEGQDMILQTHLLTLVTGQNHLLLGPPGAAKTMGVDFLFNYKPNGIWTRQVTEWTTPFDMFGGNTEEGLKTGREIINTEGSALEADYTLIDEINLANPQLLSALLSYLNPGERRLAINGVQQKAKTRSVFSTGNATRPEILETFKARKLQSGPATLNRFAFKSYVHNWRHSAQQARLDEIYSRIGKLKSLAKNGNEKQKEQAKQLLQKTIAKPIDVNAVEMLATHAFVPSTLLQSSLREFADMLRAKMNTEKFKSETENKSDPEKPIFEPATEWTERIRRELMNVVMHSAALDLMRLPKAVRDQMLKKPIELSPISIWRIVNLAITNTEGIAFFHLPELKMQFNLVKTNSGEGTETVLAPLDIESLKSLARDSREVQQWSEIDLEQTAFNDVLAEKLNIIKEDNKVIAAYLNIDEDADVDFEHSDFENVVYGLRWAKLAKSIEATKKASAQPAATTDAQN